MAISRTLEALFSAGGDVFGMLCEAGFSRVQIEVFHDLELGHLGGAPVFIVTR